MNTNTSKVTLQLDHEHVELRRRYKQTSAFSMTKPFNLKDTRSDEDVLDIMGELTKSGRDIFLEIKRSVSYKNNIASIEGTRTNTDSSRRSRAIKELCNFNLIKRVPVNSLHYKLPKNSYMINPEYIRPSDQYAEFIYDLWNKLK